MCHKKNKGDDLMRNTDIFDFEEEIKCIGMSMMPAAMAQHTNRWQNPVEIKVDKFNVESGGVQPCLTHSGCLLQRCFAARLRKTSDDLIGHWNWNAQAWSRVLKFHTVSHDSCSSGSRSNIGTQRDKSPDRAKCHNAKLD